MDRNERRIRKLEERFGRQNCGRYDPHVNPALIHVKTRARQHYSLELSTRDVLRLREIIERTIENERRRSAGLPCDETKYAHHLFRQSGQKDIWAVYFAERWLTVAFSHTNRTIKTILPPENEYIQGFPTYRGPEGLIW